MKVEHIFFSQYICTGLWSAQCIGVGSTPIEAIGHFGTQKECMLIAAEALMENA